MLDLHCHILPGIDDGPPDLEGSVELARELVAEEVGTVAATPHCRPDHPRVVPAELADRCDELNARLRDEHVRLQALPAGEVDLVWALDASDHDLRRVSYGQRGNTLLVETPYGPLANSFEDKLFELALKGFRVLLAHPERNPTLRDDIPRVAELVRRGVVTQITAGSLIHSPKQSRTAAASVKLLHENLAHVIASDSHRATGGRASLRDGAMAAVELVGKARTRWLVVGAPAAIVAGRPLPPAPPVSQPKKRPLLERLGL